MSVRVPTTFPSLQRDLLSFLTWYDIHVGQPKIELGSQFEVTGVGRSMINLLNLQEEIRLSGHRVALEDSSGSGVVVWRLRLNRPTLVLSTS